MISDEIEMPSRKSIRADFHDYSGGDYFVTICTQNKEHFFGEIRNDKLEATEIARYCMRQFEDIPKHYSYASCPLVVIMPNHIHAVITIDNREFVRRNPNVVNGRSALSIVVGGVKRAVKVFALKNNIEFAWQGRYYDHIIRGTFDGNNIERYIDGNEVLWGANRFNPDKIDHDLKRNKDQ